LNGALPPDAESPPATWGPRRRRQERSYQVTRTLTTPWEGGASSANVALATSTIRPTAKGPRDTTRQVMEAPDAAVTRMVEPMGAWLSAQVPVGMVDSQVAAPTSRWVAGAATGAGLVVVVVVTFGAKARATRGGAVVVVDTTTGFFTDVVVVAGRRSVVGGSVLTLLAASIDGAATTMVVAVVEVTGLITVGSVVLTVGVGTESANVVSAPVVNRSSATVLTTVPLDGR
jgi:microcompartment protein CcmK/EutM